MPLALAFAGSILIHLGAMFGAEWELPGLSGPEPPPVVSVVLANPEPVAVPKPASRPAVRPVPKASAPIPAAPAAAPAPAVPLPSTPDRTPADNTPAVTEAPAVAAVPAVIPTALPARGRVRYTITRGEQGFVVGQSVHEWEHDGRLYRARSVTETTGLAALFKPARVLQTSEGELVPEGLRPRQFRHERVNGLDLASFDWERGLIAYEGREAGLPPGTQDMLSLYYQASLQAAPGAPLELPVATGRKLERYRFEARGEERLSAAGREWQTVHLAARGAADGIEIWVSPELRGLPLKIRFVDRKGEVFDQVADRIGMGESP